MKSIVDIFVVICHWVASICYFAGCHQNCRQVPAFRVKSSQSMHFSGCNLLSVIQWQLW